LFILLFRKKIMGKIMSEGSVIEESVCGKD